MLSRVEHSAADRLPSKRYAYTRNQFFESDQHTAQATVREEPQRRPSKPPGRVRMVPRKHARTAVKGVGEKQPTAKDRQALFARSQACRRHCQGRKVRAPEPKNWPVAAPESVRHTGSYRVVPLRKQWITCMAGC